MQLPRRLLRSHVLVFVGLAAAVLNGAVTRDGPSINGLLDGDLYQLQPHSVDVNGGGRIEGVWYLPGTPNLVLQGGVLASGGIGQGDGASEPSGYLIRLNWNSYVAGIKNRTVLTELPAAQAPSAPTGDRSVHINGPSHTIGDPSTLRDLSINVSGVEIALPAGRYGQISINGASALVLGSAGSAEPSVYDIASLNLNSSSRLQVLGPVLLRLNGYFSPNGTAGNSDYPEWLRIDLASGGMNLNSEAVVYGVVICPAQSVTINGRLEGNVIAGKLTINSGGIYRERASLVPSQSGNEPPVAEAGDFQVGEDAVLQASLTASDADSDPLSFSLLTLPGHGTASLTALGALTYTPDANYHGTDRFTFTVSDGDLTSAPATVSITVEPVNDAPVAVDDAATTDEDTAVTIDVLANDTDVEGGDLSVLAVSDEQSGTASVHPDGTVTFTPAADYFGEAGFSYTVTDGDLASAPATVSITVEPVNDAPTAEAAEFAAAEDNSLAGTLTGSDVEGDALAFALADARGHGSATVNRDGGFTYTPDADFNGSDSFTFTVSDGDLTSVPATVSITIEPVNDAPVVDLAASAEADISDPLRLDASVSDDGDSGFPLILRWEKRSGPGSVVFSDAASRETEVSFGSAGNYVLGFLADDGRLTAGAEIAVTVVGDSPPEIVSQPLRSIRLYENPRGESVPMDLRFWQPVQFARADGDVDVGANWAVTPDGSKAVQSRNAEPSILLGGVRLKNQEVRGSFSVQSTGDDDWIGFVFGYQDEGRFYLFDWKKADQIEEQSGVETRRGMRVRRVDSQVPVYLEDLIAWAGSGDGRIETLYANDIGWEHQAEYEFSLRHFEDRSIVRIERDGRVLDEITVVDDRFPSGAFGFYNCSQEGATYSGFTLAPGVPPF